MPRVFSTVNSTHTSRSFSCPCCYKVHLDNSTLRAHISQFHGEKMPYTCNLCGKGYLSTSGLSRHMQSHKGKTFMCPICDSKFTQKFTVKSHLRTVHGLDQCINCSSVLKLGIEFTQHMKDCDGNKFSVLPV
uniref:C2H2-type domain-containing protein n=2 Tax=Arion vulgaris TaxID=1028688 RepID=A0A0B6ZLT3_9EUPU